MIWSVRAWKGRTGEGVTSGRKRELQRQIIAEFRANAGKIGGPFQGAPMLLLHHTGAKSGTERVNPLMYQQVGDSYAIFASRAGAPSNPDWYSRSGRAPGHDRRNGHRHGQGRARVANRTSGSGFGTSRRKSPRASRTTKSAAPRVIPVILLDPVA